MTIHVVSSRHAAQVEQTNADATATAAAEEEELNAQATASATPSYYATGRKIGTGQPEQIEWGTPIDQASLGDSSQIVYLDVEEIQQLPELPTGCELTAACMIVNYAGHPVDKVELDRYLPKSRDSIGDGDGTFVNSRDPDLVFVGDTRSESGSACNAGPIVTAVNSYFASIGSEDKAVDITGETPQQLYDRVKSGTPVAVWVTTYMSDYGSGREWGYTLSNGKEVTFYSNFHAMTLIGYSENNVILNDPLAETVVYPKSQFEEVYTARGCRAVIIEKASSNQD